MKTKVKLFCFCVAFGLGLATQAGFIFDIHINSAENPSLSFGEVSTSSLTRESPFPPYSGMFGVVDVCFAGATDAPKWYDRLAEDIKSEDIDNKWVLVAKSNARITWELKEGEIPEDLKIAWYDAKAKTDKWEKIKDGETLSLKTGTAYTIKKVAGEDFEPDENPDKSTGYAEKIDGEITPIVFDLGILTGQPEVFEMRFYFNAGNGEIRYPEEPGKEGALWEVNFNTPGYTPEYRWDEDDPNILIITLTANGEGTRGGNWEIVLRAQKTSAAPLSLSELSDLFGDMEDTLYAIVLRLGTLDFDDDGEITIDDVMYLYNFVQNGCDPDTSADDIKDFTSANSSDSKRAIAIEFLKSYTDELKFSGSSELTMDDVMFMYNFVQNGSDPDTSTEDITDFNSGSVTPKERETALQTLKEYAE